MSDICIDKPNAEIQEIGNNAGNMLRAYCLMYPNVYNLQIRAENPINGRQAKGKKRNLIATVSVTIEEVESLVSEMKAYRDGLPSKFAG